ncbi:MAG: DUF3145 domain-containing protein [Actinobacteria bacterium]|nr:DUF3145 domain-containing protein [Actinomycetota bacterium]
MSALVPLHPAEATTPARGVVYIHACPRALSPHVEWALSEILGIEVTLEWTPQPIAVGMVRGELSWQAPPGTGAAVASALGGFAPLRFEVTEEPTPGREGERFAVTPSLGLFRATIGIHGDVMISEDRLRSAMQEAAGPQEFNDRVSGLLGQAWDDELEPFRFAGDGNSVRWLHQVG